MSEPLSLGVQTTRHTVLRQIKPLTTFRQPRRGSKRNSGRLWADLRSGLDGPNALRLKGCDDAGA
jgi:hypothetical protein